MIAKLLIVIVTVNTVASQLILKRAVGEIGAPASFAELGRFFAAAAISPWVYASLFLQVIGYAIWMIVIAQEKLGVAVAVSGSAFYVLTAMLAWWLYAERLTGMQWAGIGLITVGVVLMFAQPA
jgi:drug/metabolite transporter (DMT)-like permease